MIEIRREKTDNLIVKRAPILLLVFLLLPTFVFSDVKPTSDELGIISTVVEEGSELETALSAFYSDFDDKWIEKYTNGDLLFISSYSKALSEMLPMKNLIASEDDDSVELMSLTTQDRVTVFFQDGKIYALSI